MKNDLSKAQVIEFQRTGHKQEEPNGEGVAALDVARRSVAEVHGASQSTVQRAEEVLRISRTLYLPEVQ